MHPTNLLINTTSEEILYARTERDVLLLKELSNSHSRKSYTKHTTEWVCDKLWKINPDDCFLTYTGTPKVTLMTDEEIEDYERDEEIKD